MQVAACCAHGCCSMLVPRRLQVRPDCTTCPRGTEGHAGQWHATGVLQLLAMLLLHVLPPCGMPRSGGMAWHVRAPCSCACTLSRGLTMAVQAPLRRRVQQRREASQIGAPLGAFGGGVPRGPHSLAHRFMPLALGHALCEVLFALACGLCRAPGGWPPRARARLAHTQCCTLALAVLALIAAAPAACAISLQLQGQWTAARAVGNACHQTHGAAAAGWKVAGEPAGGGHCPSSCCRKWEGWWHGAGAALTALTSVSRACYAVCACLGSAWRGAVLHPPGWRPMAQHVQLCKQLAPRRTAAVVLWAPPHSSLSATLATYTQLQCAHPTLPPSPAALQPAALQLACPHSRACCACGCARRIAAYPTLMIGHSTAQLSRAANWHVMRITCQLELRTPCVRSEK